MSFDKVDRVCTLVEHGLSIGACFPYANMVAAELRSTFGKWQIAAGLVSGCAFSAIKKLAQVTKQPDLEIKMEAYANKSFDYAVHGGGNILRSYFEQASILFSLAMTIGSAIGGRSIVPYTPINAFEGNSLFKKLWALV